MASDGYHLMFVICVVVRGSMRLAFMPGRGVLVFAVVGVGLCVPDKADNFAWYANNVSGKKVIFTVVKREN